MLVQSYVQAVCHSFGKREGIANAKISPNLWKQAEKKRRENLKKKRNREKEKTREKKAVWQILFIQALMDEGAFGYGAAWLGRRRLHCAEILMILQL